MKSLYISLVIPVLNEETSLPFLYSELKRQLKKYKYEIIFVNDGSTDKSASIIEEFHKKDRQVKLINLSRNFGHQMAITCGLDFAGGDAIVIMDADLQDPPEIIHKFIQKWQEGYEVVYGIRQARKGESFLKILTAQIFYKLLNFLSPLKIPPNVGDFRLVSKRVVNKLSQTRESQRFLRGMISWVGFPQTGVSYVRNKRQSGQSKFSTLAMLNLGLDALFSFSTFPLRIASFVGLMTAAGAGIYLIYALIVTLQGNTVRGWSSLIVLILFLGSVQLISLGIIGEYLGRIYAETKRRPLYLIHSTLGITQNM